MLSDEPLPAGNAAVPVPSTATCADTGVLPSKTGIIGNVSTIAAARGAAAVAEEEMGECISQCAAAAAGSSASTGDAAASTSPGSPAARASCARGSVSATAASRSAAVVEVNVRGARDCGAWNATTMSLPLVDRVRDMPRARAGPPSPPSRIDDTAGATAWRDTAARVVRATTASIDRAFESLALAPPS